MAVRSRHRIQRAGEHDDLLDSLLEAPVQRPKRTTPVALRSIERERDHALRGFLRRTWVDHVLKHAERLLVFAALFVFGLWATDGPLRDWLHAQQVVEAQTVHIVPTAVAEQPAASSQGAVLLPYSEPADSSDADAGVLSPRSVAPPGETAAQNREPSRLLIPSIGVDTSVKTVYVVDGIWQVADYAAGFMNGTALPGETGNTVLAGHAGVRGAVFRDIGQLAPGDEIYLDADGWRFHYRVRSSTAVWPNQVEVLDSHGRAELTLITCTNWDTQRLVVNADLLDSLPTPGASPAR